MEAVILNGAFHKPGLKQAMLFLYNLRAGKQVNASTLGV